MEDEWRVSEGYIRLIRGTTEGETAYNRVREEMQVK